MHKQTWTNLCACVRVQQRDSPGNTKLARVWRLDLWPTIFGGQNVLIT